VVLRAGSNSPIANAQVTLALSSSGSHADGFIRIMADRLGKFTFPPVAPILPPNGYRITSDADGFVSNGPSGVLVNFPGQQKVRNVTVFLGTYPAASGTVRTPDVQPVAAALIRAYRIHYTPIGRRLRIERTTLTNDLGEFRINAIEPADYYVSTSYSERARAAPISGTLLTPNLSNPDSGYVTAYYPAAISSADANAFTVLATGEKSNLNITLKEANRFKVHVHVFGNSTLLLQHFSIALMPAGADLGDVEDYAVKGNGGEDFDIRDVGPGSYTLVAFDKGRILSEAVPVTVDHDLEVKIPVYDPLDIPGVVVDEGGNPIPGKMSARLVRTDPELGQTIRADVESGTFVVPNVGPGAYEVYVDGLPRNAYIKEVRFPVNDNKFGRIRIDPDKPARTMEAATQRWKSDPVIQVVVTTSHAVVEGIVWTGAYTLDGPIVVPGAQVVFEPNRQDATYAVREDRFIMVNADLAGHFRLIGVPPGLYTVFGFVEIPQDLYFDSEFNMRISNFGVLVNVIDNETVKMVNCDRSAVEPHSEQCLLRVPREQSIGVAP